MISIYLDDYRTPIEHPEGAEWLVVRNYDQFVDKVTEIGLENIVREQRNLRGSLDLMVVKYLYFIIYYN